MTAGTLTLGRPQVGVVSTFDARDYSLIDFLPIEYQWTALVQVGLTLRIVFSDGSVIELLNFYSHSLAGDTSGDTANGGDYTGTLADASGDFLVRTSADRADVNEGICPNVLDHKNQRLRGRPCIRRS